MNRFNKIWGIYRSYVIVTVACLLLLFTKSHVIALLNNCVHWLQSCSETWFAIISTCFMLSLSAVIIAKIYYKEQQVAHTTLAFTLFFILFYSYFRFIDDEYEFWGSGWYKWCDIFFLPFLLLVIQKIVCGRRSKKEEDKPCLHIMDKPIDSPEEDRFGYDWMSQSLLEDLAVVDVSKKSFSVGILGVWGQGKSSFMNLFKRNAKSSDAIVVEFYPRASKSIKNIQEDFFKALKAELKHYHTGINRYISNYARAVAETDESWIGKLALAFISLSPDSDRERINSVIEAIGRKIFVMIEDLDRLTGEEILEVLKLLERNGDFCNTIFITAYDKVYVNEVIGKYLQHSLSMDYTDKYFDYEYSLPVNSYNVLSSFAGQYLADRIELKEGDRISLAQLKDAWNVNGGFIVARLGTMRHVKRYLNIFMSRYPKVKNDVDVADFMILTLLRYTDLNAYNAIFNFQIIKRGSLYSNGTPKLIYLQDDYEAKLGKLGISDDSKNIIERLFNKAESMSGALLENVYGKIEWAESFNSYFFDYRIGKYHYEDFQRLFSENEETCFKLVKEMQQAGITAQLTDFLKSRNENWLADEKGLARFIKIIVYLDSLERTMDLDFMIDGIQIASTMDGYVKAGVVKDKDTYKSVVRKTLEAMVENCPMEIGFSCHRLNTELFENKASLKDFVFTSAEQIELAIWAQRYYYRKYETGEYQINAILNLAKVEEKVGDVIQIAEPAKRELVALMTLHPDQFAEDIVTPASYTPIDGMTQLNLRFNEYFIYERLLDLEDFSFKDWIDSLADKKAAYVIRKIWEKGRTDVLQVPALKREYEKGDFEGFYKAVKMQEDKEDDKVVLEIIKSHLSLDLHRISELSGLSIERINGAVARLLSYRDIDSKYGNMKERMDPFEKGDFVKFIDSAYTSYTDKVYYSDNVFRITEINENGTLKLVDIVEPVPIKDVEAIPIDGVHDRKLYYDPIIMASIVAYDQPVPAHHSNSGEYYMDGLARTTYEGKTLKDIVIEKNCQFVHEVQHCLRKEVNTDDLKLYETIKR